MNPVVRFLLKVVLLYITWFFLYEQWLHPQEKFDLVVIDNSLFFSSKLLHLLGYNTQSGARELLIADQGGLYIGDPCNGINLIALFIGFIIAFPGDWKKKIIYILAGSLFIHALNILRIVALSLIQIHSPETLAFNHTYTFTFVIYAFIFIMWIWWVNKFSKTNPDVRKVL